MAVPADALAQTHADAPTPTLPCARVRNGRTLTDVSGKLALLTPGQQCTFTINTAPWAGIWAPSLTLRFSRSGKAWPPHHLGYPWRKQRPLRAATSLALPFSGGSFAAGLYNFQPFTFDTPAQRPPRATIESIISGGWVGGWAAGQPAHASALRPACRRMRCAPPCP